MTKFPIAQESLSPFPSTYPSEGLTGIDLETRSLLQALYYVSHGVEIPPEHVADRLATITRAAPGQPFDWKLLMGDLFRVYATKADDRPSNAHVAVPYKGDWFYIDQADQDTKATFSLLLELSRPEVLGKAGSGPLLTLPLSGNSYIAGDGTFAMVQRRLNKRQLMNEVTDGVRPERADTRSTFRSAR